MATSDTPTHPYFSEFVSLLNERRARYLVVGGRAVAFHGRPRYTKDLDLLVEPARDNARKVHEAVTAFFDGRPPDIDEKDLSREGMTVQIGVEPVRIDLNTSIAGVPDFGAAWDRRIEGALGSATASFISFEDLIAAKRAADRPQDRADVAHLEKIRDTLRCAPEPGLKGTLGRKASRAKKKATPKSPKQPPSPRKKRR